MKSLKEVRMLFLVDAKHARTLFLLQGDAAVGYIEACLSEGYVLLGADSFFLPGERSVQPTQLYELDFDRYDSSYAEFASYAVARIKQLGEDHPEVWFEIDVIDPRGLFS